METPEFHCTAQFTTKHGGGEPFAIEDLLDFPNDEGIESVEASITGIGIGDSAAAAPPSSFPDFHAAGIVGPGDGGQFASELCYDDMADELEWLSNIVDESFCSEDLQKLHLLQGIKTRPDGPIEAHEPGPRPEPPSETTVVPAKARSKRPRGAPGKWASRVLAAPPPPPPAAAEEAAAASKKENEGRRCVHCATDKTPQWRTGPMGPKTLCNACGVRYKSGRLVPEYRPAASPTFVLTKHSNSHRKVMELRRQKEVRRAQQQYLHHHHQSMMFDGDDYLIHQHIGPDFRQLI